MPLSWNEIKNRAVHFSKEWENELSEDAEAKTFWDEFFQIFGISRRRIATFETRVTMSDRKNGKIDLLWKGQLLVEHKSAGKDLNRAYQQAIDYFPGLKEHELPGYIVVCNFQKFRLYNLDEGTINEFSLKNLVNNIELFGFIAGYEKHNFKEENPVNIEAAELMGELHDKLKEIGYVGHNLELYLVRLLFCLFADDTGIFEKGIFLEYLELKTHIDGSDLAYHLSAIFQTLNTPREKRLSNLDESLNVFPYVNGKLFHDIIPIASFDSDMRKTLLSCCSLDWGKISPAIFGSMFQSVMNPKERRHLGAHYTSEKNILKVIKPLFLDQLWEEFEKVKYDSKKLIKFHNHISTLRFFDPACGCGNFLVISYRELRLLEIEILKKLFQGQHGIIQHGVETYCKLNVDQFYGVEIEDFPAQIAQVAMWLMDHQMNQQISQEFGEYYVRLPLKKSATIINENALRIDWDLIIEGNDNKEPKQREKYNYIYGNPPFIGSKLLNSLQRRDVAIVLKEVDKGKILDYVTGWYIKASEYIKDTKIKVAFVSTNSITQGEQVGVLWSKLLKFYKIKIHFAHRTFKWSNEAKGKAAVYCVIIGFGNFDVKDKSIFKYKDIKGEPYEVKAKNINPYCVDAKDIVIQRRTQPICNVNKIAFGNMPLDGGHFLFSDEEKNGFIENEPNAEKWFRPLISAKEYLNNKKRWCLWLEGIEPSELKKMPSVKQRVEAVKNFRLASVAPSTQKHANTPTLFRDRKTPNTYILIPSTTSENRKYIPLGFFTKESIANNSCHIIPNGSIYNFGVLMSEMHMSWVRYTCGRLENRYRYSKDLVYNNYPWPENPSEKQKAKVEDAANKILNVREEFPENSLADLYDPVLMPPILVKAHQELDKAVDLCYRPQPFTSDTNRIEYLFELYDKYTNPLIPENDRRERRMKKIKKSMN
jgi:hypothetical protein